ncbi:hypothetical protein [Flavobacterium sp. MK4S-17]|uniref:hypothetical protein n=1 Tax=Flavobacterium sp. MK4S-17 TaxID=2543737 RepID=UPI00135A091F|nr:hypothetical protein [Flavobacterium sp. MK4S-17]
MKSKVLFLFLIAGLVSCGGDKPKNAEAVEANKETPNNFVVEIDAIYEKNDSLVFYYEVDGTVKYENPVTLKVNGSPEPQLLKVEMPKGIALENLTYTVSTNKEQLKVKITNISIKNGDKVIDGRDFKYSEYFMSDESFKWNDADKSYIVSHDNKYPPAFVGNDNLRAKLFDNVK